MTDSAVIYSAADGIARITLNRPEASNVLDMELGRAIIEAAGRAAADDSVRVLVIAANGPRFCAGGDLQFMAGAEDPATELLALAEVGDAAHRALTDMPKPVIAAVQGAAAGAGLALALSCDIVVATDQTRFLTAYANVGLTPDTGASWLLPRAVGTQRALEMALLGTVVVGEQAKEWGIATVVVPAEELEATTNEIAARIAAMSPFAMGQAKRLVRADTDRVSHGRDESETIAKAVATPEARDLIRKFTSK